MIRPLFIVALVLAVAGCNRNGELERTLEKLKPGEPLPKAAAALLPQSLAETPWTTASAARATSEYPLAQGGELCRAVAYVLAHEAQRHGVIFTFCGGKPLAGPEARSVTFIPASGVDAKTRLDLRFSIALGPQQEVLWLTERTLLPGQLLTLHERAWRERDGRLVQVMDHLVSDAAGLASLPEKAQRQRLMELTNFYAAGFTGSKFPVPFVINMPVRGAPTTIRLHYSEQAGFQPPPMIPGSARPPVSAPPSAPTTDAARDAGASP